MFCIFCIQVHLQTLPSLLLQTCLIYQHGLLNVDVTALPIALAITQLILAGTTIALTTLVLSMPTSGVIAAAPPTPTSQTAVPTKYAAVDEEKMMTAFPSRRQEVRGCSGHQCLITAVRSICLLWCRTVAVGVFMTEFHVWTLIVFGVHWCIALLWLVLQDSASELHSGYNTAPPSPAVSLFRRALVAYLLVFDWPPRYQPKHSGWSASHKAVNPAVVAPAVGSWLDVVGLGGEPRSVAVALYYGISGVENAAMLSLWFHFAPPSVLVPPVARLTTLATCTAALTLGVLCVVASTQGPDEESASSSSTLTSNRTTISSDSTTFSSTSRGTSSSSAVMTKNQQAFIPPCTVIQQREIQTVVAQVHPPRKAAVPASTPQSTTTRLTQAALSMAANHSHPPMEPPPPPPPETTWDRAMSVCDDESSNSRNTNTLDGGLMGGSGGSGSCPSPPLYNAATIRLSSSPAVNMKTHPACRSQPSPFRDPSTFTSSLNGSTRQPNSAAATVSVATAATSSIPAQMDLMVKRPYLSSGCPLSSTPRLIRRNSSFGSSLVIKSARIKASATTTGRHRRRKHQHQSHHHGCRPRTSTGSCHCRIFDDYGMGILIKENPISKSGTLTIGQSSCGRLSHGLFETDSKPQLQIRCAKCLGAHDPLLTNCMRSKRNRATNKMATSSRVKSKTLPSRRKASAYLIDPQLETSICSTNYPSETEMTATRRSVSSSESSSAASSSSLDSDATYTTWPPPIRIPSMERLLSENTDPSPWNYVQAWLVNANQPQTRPRPSPAGTISGQRRHTVKRLDTVAQSSPRAIQTAVQHQVHYLMRPHRHHHQHGGVQDVYSAYCTVPPRLGQTVKELSVVRRKPVGNVSVPAKSAVAVPVAEHQYSTPSSVEYSTPVNQHNTAGLEIVV